MGINQFCPGISEMSLFLHLVIPSEVYPKYRYWLKQYSFRPTFKSWLLPSFSCDILDKSFNLFVPQVPYLLYLPNRDSVRIKII